MATVVKFLIHPKDKEVMAFFPMLFHNKRRDRKMKTCYAHLGQHSACHEDYAAECNKATPDQYDSLKKELESIGYNLKICK